jgi:hypothetical protein
MAKPTDSELFATDATFAADGDTWSGDPVRVDPGAARRAEGFEPDLLPAEWLNHQLGVLGDHVDYLNGIVEADGSESLPAVTRTITIDALEMRPYVNGAFDAQTVQSGAGRVNGFHVQIPAGNATRLFLPLNRYVPEGADLKTADLLITPATTHTLVGRFSLLSFTPNFTTPAQPVITEAAGADTTGAVAEVLALSGTWAFTSTKVWVLQYHPGTITVGADNLFALRITFDDPGPRNF